MDTTRLKEKVASSRLARLAVFPMRARLVARHDALVLGQSLRWLLFCREHTNLSYDLSPRNRLHLRWFLSLVTDTSVDEIHGYLDEVQRDEYLRSHIRRATAASPRRHLAESRVAYGRRIGWYAIIRATRPAQVVETGTDKGLGSVVMAAALIKNAEEGDPGHLTTIDINPNAGYLICDKYGEVTTLTVGDSLEQLKSAGPGVDVFLHDSDHRASHESAEYRAVSTQLSDRAIVLSDNAHLTDELAIFAASTGRRFLFFDERPDHHWYPGGGLGVAWAGAPPASGRLIRPTATQESR